MTEINDAAVEAGARAMFASDACYPVRAWDEGRHPYDEDEREEFRALARAALTAALPHLTAAPSATRDEVSTLLLTFLRPPKHGGSWTYSPGEAADALLARFNITPKETDRG